MTKKRYLNNLLSEERTLEDIEFSEEFSLVLCTTLIIPKTIRTMKTITTKGAGISSIFPI